MIKQIEGGGTVITGSDIGRFRLISMRGRLKLEMAGLAFRGRTTYAILKKEFGWRGSRSEVLDRLNRMIEADRQARDVEQEGSADASN